jgi:hypothetical protein
VGREETEVIETDRAILKANPGVKLTAQEQAHLLGAAFQQAAKEYGAPAANYHFRISLSETLMLSSRDMNLDVKGMTQTKKSLKEVAWPGNVIISTVGQLDWTVPMTNKGRPPLQEISNTGSARKRVSDSVSDSAVAKAGACPATAAAPGGSCLATAAAAPGGGSGPASAAAAAAPGGSGLASAAAAPGGSGLASAAAAPGVFCPALAEAAAPVCSGPAVRLQRRGMWTLFTFIMRYLTLPTPYFQAAHSRERLS